jgi:hypothetical protein
MTRTHALLTINFVTVLLVSNAQAQTTQPPAPGQWEITSTATGMPRASEPAIRSVCINTEQFAAGVQSAFQKAAEAGKRGPQRTQTVTNQQASSAAWTVSCSGGPAALQGQGTAQWSESAFSMNEQLAGKTPMGNLSISRTITAKRTGDCASKS